MAIANHRIWDILVYYELTEDKFVARFYDAEGHWLQHLEGRNTTRVGAIAQLEEAARRTHRYMEKAVSDA